MGGLPTWLQGVVSTVFITVVPIFIIYLINLTISDKHRRPFVNVMMSFGLGGLLGEVFCHQLPEVLGAHSHHHHHDVAHIHADHHTHDHAHDHGHSGHHHSPEQMYPSLVMLASVYAFFLFEIVTEKMLDGGHSHSHDHSNEEKSEEEKRNLRM